MMARNGKSNGRNGVPAWAAADLKLLKKVSLSIVEDIRETRRIIAAERRRFARSEAQHKARFAQNEERIEQNQERIEQNERLLVEWKQEHRAEMDTQRAEMAQFKKISDIHSKAIIKLLKE